MAIDFNGWLSEFCHNLRKRPKYAFAKAVYYTYLGLWYTITSRYDLGMNVYERDWDALIILDACRVDALQEVANEYKFIEKVDSIRSVGSTSHEWMAKTFTEQYRREISQTAHITANGYSYKSFVRKEMPPSGGNAPFGWPDWDTVEESAFSEFEMVWQGGHDEDLGNVPPRIVTDQTISIAREQSSNRMLVHYAQPHAPYLHRAIKQGESPSEIEYAPFDALRDGKATKSEIWDLYLDNLRLVMDEVELLLKNLDANKVIITSDHGEAFGEHGVYEHPDGFPFPNVKRVPWVETSASDQRTHTPEPDSLSRPETKDIEDDLQDHLRDLGYV